MSWLSTSLPVDQVVQLQAAAVDRPEAQAFFAIQARNLERLSARRREDRARHRRQRALGPASRDGRHGRDGHDAGAGHRRLDRQCRGVHAAHRCRHGGYRQGASFIVLEANPLDDITNTRRIRDVYLRGEHIDRSAY